MRWSYKCGQLLGIDLYVHVTFLLLLAWFMLHDLLTGRAWLSIALHISLVLMTFAVVVAHELGHSMAARKLGIPTRDIVLLPIGGMARLERLPEKPRQELFVALAGPAVNLVFAGLTALIAYLCNVLGGAYPVPIWYVADSFLYALAVWFFWLNIGLLGFNLVPAFPMDGGRVLRALLGFKMEYLPATEWAVTIGRAIAVLFGIYGFTKQPSLVLIAMFVWYAGGSELNMVRQREYMRRASSQFGGISFEQLLRGITNPDGSRMMAIPGPLGWRIVRVVGQMASVAASNIAEQAANMAEQATRQQREATSSNDGFDNIRQAVNREMHYGQEDDEPRARIIDIE